MTFPVAERFGTRVTGPRPVLNAQFPVAFPKIPALLRHGLGHQRALPDDITLEFTVGTVLCKGYLLLLIDDLPNIRKLTPFPMSYGTGVYHTPCEIVFQSPTGQDSLYNWLLQNGTDVELAIENHNDMGLVQRMRRAMGEFLKSFDVNYLKFAGFPYRRLHVAMCLFILVLDVAVFGVFLYPFFIKLYSVCVLRVTCTCPCVSVNRLVGFLGKCPFCRENRHQHEGVHCFVLSLYVGGFMASRI